jgi:hypothetical protein
VKTSRLGTPLRRTLFAAAAVAILVLSLAAPVPAGRPYKPREPDVNAPQWVLPNIIAGFMSIGLLAIPCKRFRRT